MRRAFLFLTLTISLLGQADPGFKMPEPDYGPDADTRPYTSEVAEVTLMIAPDGVPISVLFTTQELPRAVLSALADARFPRSSDPNIALHATLQVPFRKYADPPESPQATDSEMLANGVIRGNLKKQVAPVYPDTAKRSRVQGTVLIHAVIGKNGKILRALAIDGPPELYYSAVVAVRKWEYKPYTKDGEPVEVYTEIEVNYKLR